MPLLSPEDRPIVEAIGRLTYCNPFVAERIELERRVLGRTFIPFFPLWHPRADIEDDNPNVVLIAERATALAERLRSAIVGGAAAGDDERRLYRDVCLYALYYRHHQQFFEMITGRRGKDGARRAEFYGEFRRGFRHLLELPGVQLETDPSPEHLFACFFQVRRAFHHTFRAIAGGSTPAARLRTQVWQSVFTHDLSRYQRLLFERMGDVTTLITGPSGVGKELVARAIGLSRYLPFDPSTRTFREDFEESFFPLNLSALSPTLIESELFGHRRGAFTGAIADRHGWFEVCPLLGTVFLDEIGEIEASIQVKLLRVVETRVFQRLGETEERPFRGKVVTATNRDLGREMREGRFRDDLYYRLCADTIVAPSLRERIDDSVDELPTLLLFLAQRLVGEVEAPLLADEAAGWIERNLGRDYAWPGNVRELSQCLSNVMIHRNYRPATTVTAAGPRERLAGDFLEGGLSAEEILRRYCTLVYSRTGSFVQAADRLGLDRRTVKRRIDPALLDALRGN